ncbi:MAG: GIY-YIG nuclease family protein [Candidatus Bathyarchaeota archaeon]|nr:MAG: GIY-YIG nuclease family protein [Candidatus Bathyarchaeota archaeon]
MNGVYVLIISVSKDVVIRVGAIGNKYFEKGMYAYVGSAQRGLENRVSRHLIQTKHSKFWHVDYLLNHDSVKVVDVLHKVADKSEECKIAEKLEEKSAAVRKFGSSDCTCTSHLFEIEDYEFLKTFMDLLLGG